MDNFRLKFLEEARELVEELERILLEVESRGISKESVEQIFRVMHTIKGSSSMFGFDNISEFTHNLETLYELIRSGKMELSREILEVTLLSVDHIRNLLKNDKLTDKENISVHKELSEKIKILTGDLHMDVQTSTDQKTETKQTVTTYYILFEPETDVLKKGNNPLFLLQDLQDLGQSKVIWHMQTIPAFQEINVTDCYIYWEIFLASEKTADDIKDIFMFVEDQCKLTINEIAEENLFLQPDFISVLDTLPANQAFTDIDMIVKTVPLADSVESKSKPASPLTEEKLNAGKEVSGSSIRVSSEKLDDLMNLVSELATTQARLSLFANNHVSLSELHLIAENIEKISRQLRDNTFSICLVPIETIMTRFNRLIRDLSKQLNKEIIFLSEGTETEIDKTIIESLTDPLMHILRNCIDHGIEDAAIRASKGKPKQGTILLRAYYSGTNVHIEIKDDGAGIDKVRIREKAISKGLIKAEAVLTEKEIYDLMFLPGFSTAAQVTEVSGRGVGMDVVKRQISAIRGSVEIDSEINKSTTISILLPLTLSIIDGLLVSIDDTKYVIPLSVVHKCYEVESKNLIDKFDDVLLFEGELIPFINLRETFEINNTPPVIQQMVVVKQQGKKTGITVDVVLGQYQAVLKPLGSFYRNQDFISGATILGDGTIALVMDTNQIIKKFTHQLS